MNIYHNGALTSAAKVSISVDNRSFRYGDGLFETMIFRQGEIRLGLRHWERLTAGLSALRMAMPTGLSFARLTKQATHLLADQGVTTARLRLHVWRAGAGVYTPTTANTEYLLRADPWQPPASIAESIALSERVTLSPTPWSRYKTHNGLPYILASLEREERKFDDLLLPDMHGHVAEATYSNVFWRKADVWYTPSLDSGCLAGVMRAHLLDQIVKEGLIQEGIWKPDALQEADVCLLTNASGIRYVGRLGMKIFATHDAQVEAWKSQLNEAAG